MWTWFFSLSVHLSREIYRWSSATFLLFKESSIFALFPNSCFNNNHDMELHNVAASVISIVVDERDHVQLILYEITIFLW
jgi:hypothetical protein